MDHARHAGAGEGRLRAGVVLMHAWAPMPAGTPTSLTAAGTSLAGWPELECCPSDAGDGWGASPPAGADVHEEPWQRAEREHHATYG
jgi:hypothetical protein